MIMLELYQSLCPTRSHDRSSAWVRIAIEVQLYRATMI